MLSKPTIGHVAVAHEQIIEGRWQMTSSSKWSIANDNLPILIQQVLDLCTKRDDMRNPQLVLHLGFAMPVLDVAAAKYLTGCDWTDVGPEPEPEPPMVALIPGRMCAEYKDGQVTKVWFAPAAGDIGYQGSSFFIHSGHESYPDEEDDRPFWLAMEQYLNAANPDWEG